MRSSARTGVMDCHSERSEESAFRKTDPSSPQAAPQDDGASAPSFVLRVRFLHELVRIGELEFDFLCLHFGVEGRYDLERGSRAGVRDDSVRRDGFLHLVEREQVQDRKTTRLNSSHSSISYAVFCLQNKFI